MKYKMLVTDMDDTLLSDDLIITKENEEAIKKAIELGVRIILCSGRATKSMSRYVKQLNLDKKEQYGISYNGSIIFDTNTLKPLYKENISKEYAKFLFSYAKENKIYVQTYQNDDLIVEKSNAYSEHYSKLTGIEPVEVGDLAEWINDDVIKVLFQGDSKKLIKIAEELSPIIDGKLHMFFSKPTYLEFTSINANKGLTVKRLRKKLGFHKSEVICIGDSFNDLYMIKESGLGIAVANAHSKIREASDYITKNNNNHNAIKEVIEKFVL